MFQEMRMDILFDRPVELSIHKIESKTFDIVEQTNGEEYSFGFAEIEKEVDAENQKILHLKMRDIDSKAYTGFVKDALEDLDFFMDITFDTGSKDDPEIYIEELINIEIIGSDRSFTVEEDQKYVIDDGKISMSKNQKQKLIRYLQNTKDKQITDNDIFDISEKLKISNKKLLIFCFRYKQKELRVKDVKISDSGSRHPCTRVQIAQESTQKTIMKRSRKYAYRYYIPLQYGMLSLYG